MAEAQLTPLPSWWVSKGPAWPHSSFLRAPFICSHRLGDAVILYHKVSLGFPICKRR